MSIQSLAAIAISAGAEFDQAWALAEGVPHDLDERAAARWVYENANDVAWAGAVGS